MAETHKEIVKVWIAPGCIVCDACETDCPEVFDVQEETCLIRPEALKADFTRPLTPSIIIAAEGCPVDVIKFDTIDVEGPEPWAGKKQEAAKAAPAGGGGSGGGGGAKKGVVIPEGPPNPKWSGLLSTSYVSGSRTGGGPPVEARPAKAPAEVIAAALPKDAPPDAVSAATVGTAFVRPRPSVADRIRGTASRAAMIGETRRGFIQTAVAGLIAVVGSGWTYIGLTAAAGGAALQSFMVPKVTKEPPSIFRAGKVSDYPDPGVYELFKGTQGVWIVHEENHQLVALSTICTHLGCIPNWLSADRKFKCPCHGSGFYMSGINFEGPAPRPLERHKIYLEGEVVIVDKSAKYRQELGQWDNAASYVTL